jgi:hypothetical protein
MRSKLLEVRAQESVLDHPNYSTILRRLHGIGAQNQLYIFHKMERGVAVPSNLHPLIYVQAQRRPLDYLCMALVLCSNIVKENST